MSSFVGSSKSAPSAHGYGAWARAGTVAGTGHGHEHGHGTGAGAGAGTEPGASFVGLDIRGGAVAPSAGASASASAPTVPHVSHVSHVPVPYPDASPAYASPSSDWPRRSCSRSRSRSRARSRSRSRSRSRRSRDREWEWEREGERELEQRNRNRDRLAHRPYQHYQHTADTDSSPHSQATHLQRRKRAQGGHGAGAFAGVGVGVLGRLLRARFLFPFSLGLVLGVLAMCAFIVIYPSMQETLLCTLQTQPSQDTSMDAKAARGGGRGAALFPSNPMAALPEHSSQSVPVSSGLAVSGSCRCPACPPPVCSGSAAGSGGCHKGMPRWSRWMRDTFLGHMVNFTHEWLQKPEQLVHQLNYLINPEGNFDNVQKLAFLDPFLDGVTDPGLSSAKWLTVADGYFGMEGAYVHHRARELRRKHMAANPSAKAIPDIHVTGTALSNMTLKYALKLGFVDAISEENVEDLSFPDERFDYVLIKEAFHHLTRPYMGLYELIRVCRHGVILIEPTEIAGRPTSYWSSVPPMARSLVIPDVAIGFESDLIQFRLSVHELQKIAMALNLPAVAVKGLNNPMGSRGNRTRYFSDLDNLNSLGLAGKRPFNLVAAVVFKQPPSHTLKQEMIKQHFLFLDVVYTTFPYDDWQLYPNL